MSSKDFNLLMDDYIDGKRTTKNIPFISNKKKRDYEDEVVPEGVSSHSVYVIKKPKSFLQRLIEKFTLSKEEDFEEEKRVEKTESIESEQEFEQELDEMKEEEKKTTFFGWLFKFFSSNVDEEYEDLDDEERLEENKPQEKKEETAEVHIEDIKEDADEKKGRSFFLKFLDFIGISVKKEYDVDEERHAEEEHRETPSMETMLEMKEDLKEVAIIATATFKKLPKEQFKLFKNSSDFKKFKEILKRNNIIKVKEEEKP